MIRSLRQLTIHQCIDSRQRRAYIPYSTVWRADRCAIFCCNVPGVAAIAVALIHGVLGETKVFARATIEPPRLRTLIRLVWQAGTVAWIGGGVLLIAAPWMASEPARHWIIVTWPCVFAFAALRQRLGDARPAFWLGGAERRGRDGGRRVLGAKSRRNVPRRLVPPSACSTSPLRATPAPASQPRPPSSVAFWAAEPRRGRQRQSAKSATGMEQRVTPNPALDLQHLIAANASAAFNRMARFEVAAAGDGTAEIRMRWNDDFAQYAGYLHAGMIAALLDTACGFAAATIVGRVLASHLSMNCLRPAVGRLFVAKRDHHTGRSQTGLRNSRALRRE